MDAAVRQLVRHRADDRCEYCRLPQAVAPAFTFHVEHIQARQHGGGDEPSNLALACPDCNLLKGSDIASVDMETGQIVRLFNPRVDHWPEHFRLQDGQIVTLTPVGRVTEYLLQFNQPQSAQERRWLIEAGRYSGELPAGTERGHPADRGGRSDMTGGGESVAGHPGG